MILDLFAAAGGWDQGLAGLGVSDVLGLEIDGDACATATAAGHDREQVDLAITDPSGYLGVEALIASPPCQDYSTAGNGTAGSGDLTHLVLPWVRALRPEWIACEQVRGVFPIWQHVAYELEQDGYRTAYGLVDAADYGVPQHRVRAVLLASRDEQPRFPTTTHGGGLWGAPYVTMADTLGWDGTLNRRQNSRGPQGTVVPVALVPTDRPAPTVTGVGIGGSQWIYQPRDGEPRAVTVAEGARLQGFPDGYPWQGTRKSQGTQIGNAVPPPLAAALLRQFVASEALAA